jgi:hypothetical protein
MTEYTTETGFYILVDADGRVMSKASVPVGTHPVEENADPSQSYDVDTREDLDGVTIDPYYVE